LAAPWLARRFGGAPIARGALLLAVGHALQFVNVAVAGEGHLVAWMIPLLLMQGAGLGIVMAPLVSAVLAGLPAQHAGVASGVLATFQQAGNALGVALIGLLFYGLLDAAGSPDAYGRAFSASLLYLTVSALLVAVLYRRVVKPRRTGR
jgi:MFS family permease